MLTIDASLATGSSVSKFTIDGGELVQGSQNSTAGASDFTAMMKLPSDGVGIFEWPAALRNGMSVMFNSKVNDSAGTQEMLSNGQPISYTNDSLDVLEASFGLDASGITVTGAADGYSIDTLDPSFPLPIKATAARVIGEFAMPLLASDDPQAFVYGMGFEDVVIDESLMGMIDPTQGLGRDPITMRLNTKGNVGTTLDLLDFPALMALEQEYNMPFSIHDFSITELYLAAAGAELNGVGDFTFDMNNLDTFDGIPAPTGALDLSMVGFNGLLDKLVAAGFLPEQQAMGARMMTGLFAQPGAGEDSLTSKIEIDGATGAISANGQRLQ